MKILKNNDISLITFDKLPFNISIKNLINELGLESFIVKYMFSQQLRKHDYLSIIQIIESFVPEWKDDMIKHIKNCVKL